MSCAASTATPTDGRSTTGRWWRTASMRAMPSEVAAPSSMRACVTGVPFAARARTSGSTPTSISVVASSRSRRSSDVSSTPNGVASVRAGAGAASAGVASSASGTRVSFIAAPSNGLSACASPPLTRYESEEPEVRVEDRVAEEERDDRAQREERDERNAHLPRRRSVAAHEDGCRHERREETDHERDGDGRTEHRAEKERELHVAHPEPLGIGEHNQEERAGRDQRPHEPREGRVDGRVRDEGDRGSREHDPVRDDAVVRIDDGQDDENAAESRCERRFRGETVDRDAGDDEERGDRLDERVRRRDAGVAVPAMPAKQRVREHRDVVAPQDFRAAAPAGRGWPQERPPLGHTGDDDVQEAPERERRCEDHRQGSRAHAPASGYDADATRSAGGPSSGGSDCAGGGGEASSMLTSAAFSAWSSAISKSCRFVAAFAAVSR